MKGKLSRMLLLGAATLIASCGGSTGGEGSADVADIPSECERYFQALAACTDGRASTPEEASRIYADMVKGYQDNGSGAATPQQCSAAADLLQGSC